MTLVTVLPQPLNMYGNDAWSQVFTLTEGGQPIDFAAHGTWHCQVVGSRDGTASRVAATVQTGASGQITVSLASSQLDGFVPSALDVRSVAPTGQVRSWVRASIRWTPAITDPTWK